MPLFDYICLDCGEKSEILMISTSDEAACSACGSEKVRKVLSPHAVISGVAKRGRLPGPGDTACCGSSPSETGCAGPGSCCGKN